MSQSKQFLLHVSSLLILDIQEIEELEPWVNLAAKDTVSVPVLILGDMDKLLLETMKVSETEQKKDALRRQFKGLFPQRESIKRTESILAKIYKKGNA